MLNTEVFIRISGFTVQISRALSLPIHLHANFSAYFGQFNFESLFFVTFMPIMANS